MHDLKDRFAELARGAAATAAGAGPDAAERRARQLRRRATGRAALTVAGVVAAAVLVVRLAVPEAELPAPVAGHPTIGLTPTTLQMYGDQGSNPGSDQGSDQGSNGPQPRRGKVYDDLRVGDTVPLGWLSDENMAIGAMVRQQGAAPDARDSDGFLVEPVVVLGDITVDGKRSVLVGYRTTTSRQCLVILGERGSGLTSGPPGQRFPDGVSSGQDDLFIQCEPVKAQMAVRIDGYVRRSFITGRVPAGARRVRVELTGRSAIEADVNLAPDLGHGFFLAPAPPNLPLRVSGVAGRAVALDAGGRELASVSVVHEGQFVDTPLEAP
jgi:hypothetical protein